MSFDRTALIAACRSRGAVARVVIARVRGSAPREVGAAMLVWSNGQSGTIGGGALEYALAKSAREDLTPGNRVLSRHALGPDLGQCCGGAVDVMTEVFDADRAEALAQDFIARGPGSIPLAVQRSLALARRGEKPVMPHLCDGWMVEPVHRAERPLWIWGAGHVGRAIIRVLAPLPDFAVTWVDTDAARFPARDQGSAERLVAKDPGSVVRFAPADAEHLILTFSHEIDLDLCHRLLSHGFRSAGLIGSKTKWARFKKRLAALGHGPETIGKIACPIGTPALGKDPQAIAIGVAASLLAPEVSAALEGKRA